MLTGVLIMPAQKIDHKHSFSVKARLEAKKLIELKNLIKEGQKKIGFDDQISNMLNFFFDKVAEGKTVSVVDLTELWSVTQTAKELGVTRPTIYKMYDRGDLQGVSLDGLKIVPSSAIAYLKRQEEIRTKALAELHEIDQQLKPETREWTSDKSTRESFEDIDLE